MVKKTEKVKLKSVQIDETLYNEIIATKDSLNNTEKNKTKGYKKQRWTFPEASKKMGLMLKRMREERKRKENI